MFFYNENKFYFFKDIVMTGDQFLMLVTLLVPGLLLSFLVMISFAKGG